MSFRKPMSLACRFALVVFILVTSNVQGNDSWNTYTGGEGAGRGKSVVLVSGDEEYRSEEALSQLAKILSARHGFDCVVLYAIDEDSGEIAPNEQTEYSRSSSIKESRLDGHCNTLSESS